jgi:hypothetical protein
MQILYNKYLYPYKNNLENLFFRYIIKKKGYFLKWEITVLMRKQLVKKLNKNNS